VNGEALAQVMQTRLMSGVGGSAHDIGADPQAAKGHLGVLPSHRIAGAGKKERRSRLGMLLSAAHGVQGQDPDQIFADRHQPRFVKLALANAEDPCVEIDIGQGKGECFTDAEPGAIQQEQERSIGIWSNATAWMVIDRDGIKQTT
jgi:hypothetical protein